MALINCCTADYLVVVVHERGASANMGVCCRHILMVMPPNTNGSFAHNLHFTLDVLTISKLECGPMPNVMVALPNIGGALC